MNKQEMKQQAIEEGRAEIARQNKLKAMGEMDPTPMTEKQMATAQI